MISITDELSGVFNRRYIMNRLENEVQKNKISVIMFDIDHFKEVNDNYGHSIGDRVIQKVSNVLKDNIRSTDSLGWIGREEFSSVINELED